MPQTGRAPALVLALTLVWMVPAAAADSPNVTLEVYMIPHSHQDPGYRETVNGYWRDSVSKTITTTVQALLANPNRRFVWDETVWMRYLWESGDNATIAGLKKLVANKQMEFIGGGWTMHDEAASSLWSAANQMTYGLDYLHDKLNTRPIWAWHIDPFGHSATTPTLFSLLGFSGFVLNRIPDGQKDYRKQTKNLQFVWKGAANQLQDSSLLGHILDSHYSTPKLAGITVADRAKELHAVIMRRAKWFKTNKLLVPFGNDFQFTHAESQFSKMEELVAYINANYSDVNIRFSTLTEYFTALHNSSDAVFQTSAIGEDFFPYIACTNCTPADCLNVPCGTKDAFWSGFFTSRPHQKLISAEQDAITRALNIMQAITHQTVPSASFPNENLTITHARNTSGLLQHHDAIPGTSFNYCTISIDECDCVGDYNARIETAATSADELLGDMKARLLGANTGVEVYTQQRFSNASITTPQWTMVVSNPLGWPVKDVVEVEVVGTTSAQVFDMRTKQLVPSQLVIDSFRGKEYLYIAIELQQFEVAAYHIMIGVEEGMNTAGKDTGSSDDEATNFCNGAICLRFNATTGKLSHWENQTTQEKHTLTVDHLYLYERNPFDPNIFSGSNVYSFVPTGETRSLWSQTAKASFDASGPVVWQVSFELDEGFFTVRLFNTSLVDSGRSLQFQLNTGVLSPSSSGSIVMSVGSDVANGNTFYTDENAFQRLQRKFDPTIPLSGNYYPIVGAVSIVAGGGNSTGPGMALAARRATGGTSSESGRLDMMLHRRIIDTDRRGDDTSVMDDPVNVIVGSSAFVEDASALVSTRAMHRASLHFINGSPETSITKVSVVPCKSPLPEHTHLLDLRSRDGGSGYGLWLQGLSRREDYSGPVAEHVDFATMVPGFSAQATAWEESSLDFRLSINATRAQRWSWKTTSEGDNKEDSNLTAPAPAVPDSLATTGDVDIYSETLRAFALSN